MVNYNKSKVFAIYNDNFSNIFVGYTTDFLSRIRNINYSLNNGDRGVLLYRFLLDNLDGTLDTAYNIEIIETYACENITDIQTRVDYWQKRFYNKFNCNILSKADPINHDKDNVILNAKKRNWYKIRKEKGLLKKYINTEDKQKYKREYYLKKKNKIENE